eukprot:2963107-Pyramimonas_sp.AAC.1
MQEHGGMPTASGDSSEDGKNGSGGASGSRGRRGAAAPAPFHRGPAPGGAAGGARRTGRGLPRAPASGR